MAWCGVMERVYLLSIGYAYQPEGGFAAGDFFVEVEDVFAVAVQ